MVSRSEGRKAGGTVWDCMLTLGFRCCAGVDWGDQYDGEECG